MHERRTSGCISGGPVQGAGAQHQLRGFIGGAVPCAVLLACCLLGGLLHQAASGAGCSWVGVAVCPHPLRFGVRARNARAPAGGLQLGWLGILQRPPPHPALKQCTNLSWRLRGTATEATEHMGRWTCPRALVLLGWPPLTLFATTHTPGADWCACRPASSRPPLGPAQRCTPQPPKTPPLTLSSHTKHPHT